MKKALLLLCLFLGVFVSCNREKKVETCHGNPDEKVLIAYVYHPNGVPDPTYLTHINYAFGHVNETFDGVRIERAEWLKKISRLKRRYPHLKVILSIGGWGSGNFSEMVSDPELRMKFAKDCRRVVDEYRLDGIDIDWEYPGTSVAGISSAPTDRDNYTLMMRDIRECIGPDKILSQATDGGAMHIDYAAVDKYLDYTNVMSYDLGRTPYHRSPLYSSELMLQPGSISADSCMKAHLAAGIPKEKLVMGMIFGRAGGADPTKAHLLDGFTYHWDAESQEPYLTNDETGEVAFGYENEKSLYLKAKYVLDNGFKGAMYWSYNGDTPSGDLRRTVYCTMNDPEFTLGTSDNRPMKKRVAGKDHFKVYGWLAGKRDMPEDKLEQYFMNAARIGMDGILLECHGAYPEILQDSSSYRDSAALEIMRHAAVYAKKYDIELHAWMWTGARAELNLRKQHPDWYQVNGLGQNLNDVNLYGREYYRFLCPSHKESVEYLKDRARELAEIDGVTGVHLDFIRYPDAILPYALHESRGVVQDKVYPLWDCCYCDECRSLFKAQTGIDPIDLKDPTSNKRWMKFRWSQMAKMTSEICAEIQACGKKSSAAVFASPSESKKLVRQDWVNYRNADYLFPMIYNDSYGFPDEWIEEATREGVEGLKKAGNPAKLYSGVMFPRDPEKIESLFKYAKDGGAAGICLFSLERTAKPGMWEALEKAVKESRK